MDRYNSKYRCWGPSPRSSSREYSGDQRVSFNDSYNKSSREQHIHGDRLYDRDYDRNNSLNRENEVQHHQRASQRHNPRNDTGDYPLRRSHNENRESRQRTFQTGSRALSGPSRCTPGDRAENEWCEGSQGFNSSQSSENVYPVKRRKEWEHASFSNQQKEKRDLVDHSGVVKDYRENFSSGRPQNHGNDQGYDHRPEPPSWGVPLDINQPSEEQPQRVRQPTLSQQEQQWQQQQRLPQQPQLQKRQQQQQQQQHRQQQQLQPGQQQSKQQHYPHQLRPQPTAEEEQELFKQWQLELQEQEERSNPKLPLQLDKKPNFTPSPLPSSSLPLPSSQPQPLPQIQSVPAPVQPQILPAMNMPQGTLGSRLLSPTYVRHPLLNIVIPAAIPLQPRVVQFQPQPPRVVQLQPQPPRVVQLLPGQLPPVARPFIPIGAGVRPPSILPVALPGNLPTVRPRNLAPSVLPARPTVGPPVGPPPPNKPGSASSTGSVTTTTTTTTTPTATRMISNAHQVLPSKDQLPQKMGSFGSPSGIQPTPIAVIAPHVLSEPLVPVQPVAKIHPNDKLRKLNATKMRDARKTTNTKQQAYQRNKYLQNQALKEMGAKAGLTYKQVAKLKHGQLGEDDEAEDEVGEKCRYNEWFDEDCWVAFRKKLTLEKKIKKLRAKGRSADVALQWKEVRKFTNFYGKLMKKKKRDYMKLLDQQGETEKVCEMTLNSILDTIWSNEVKASKGKHGGLNRQGVQLRGPRYSNQSASRDYPEMSSSGNNDNKTQNNAVQDTLPNVKTLEEGNDGLEYDDTAEGDLYQAELKQEWEVIDDIDDDSLENPVKVEVEVECEESE